MAKSLTARFGLQRWSVDTDTQERAEFDAGNGKIDDLAAMDMQGVLADRPAAGAANRGLYYFVTGDATAANNDRLYRSTGAAWVEVVTGPFASAAYVAKAGATMTGALTVDPGVQSSRLRIVDASVVANESTTSTTYADLATLGPTVNFTMPPSGKVAIDFTAVVDTASMTSGFAYAAPVVYRTNDGVIEAAAGDNLAIQVAFGRAFSRYSTQQTFTGTPGVAYSTRPLHRVDQGTGRWTRRILRVTPSP